jgi:E3 ubiquitin-protein ligase SHPRH
LAVARHLIWLREKEPGVKSIVFSQYSDFLHVLKKALQHFKVGCTLISEKNGVEMFKQDPSVSHLFFRNPKVEHGIVY